MKHDQSKFASRLRGRLMAGAGIALVAGLASPALAQNIGLEEIVVTATKRASGLQDVAMSISAINDTELKRMGATEFIDYAIRIPNVGFGYAADGRFDSRKIGIRGIFGEGQTSAGGTTGFYIDDVPVPETMNPRVMDVERVEVLRGPQGTLYGARSMGGTVRLISKQPNMDEMEGRVHAKLSSVKEGDLNWAVDGALNIPLVDGKAAARVVAYYGENSGIYDRTNVTTPDPVTGATFGPFDEKNVDDESYGGVQVSVAMQVTEDLTFTPRFMYQKVKADGFPFADIDTDNYEQERHFNVDEPGEDEWYLISGTFNWDTGIGSIMSTTAYFDRSIFEREDESDLLPALIPPVPYAESPIDETVDTDSFTHETRFTSDFDSPFQIIAGVFYQKTNEFLEYPPALYPGMGAALGLPPEWDLVYQTTSDFDTEEYAAFGEMSYDITERITATVGARWSKTKVTFDRIAGGLVSDIVPDASLIRPDGGIDFDAWKAAIGSADADPTDPWDQGNQSEKSFNPKFLLEAEVTDDVKVYGSVSKGFRIGGVNASVPVVFCQADLDAVGLTDLSSIVTYDSDKVWSYEIGFKSKLADNTVTLNAAAFQIDWTDLQINNRLACGFQFIANGGKARSKGFEFELQAAPIEGLFLSVAGGYTDAKIKSVPSLATGLAAGDPVLQVPDWTLNTTGQYTFPAFDGWDMFVRADFNYYGRSYSSNNGAARLRSSWEMLNLRTGFLQDRYEVTLFVDNVTNTRANLADNRSIAAEVPGRPRLVSNRPRTFGVEFSANF